jgi:phytoene synthase
MIRLGSKSFAAAARLFDPVTRDAVVLLYGWCRHCDDQIDGQSYGHGDAALEAEAARARLESLVEATRASYRGAPPRSLVFVGFQHVVQRYAIPERYPRELLKGLEMDVAGRRYRGFEDLLLYCYRVAGTVGVMMAKVIGARDERALKHAVDLGIAMQLTNIARDVVEDARAGRVYLPLRDLREFGVSVDDLVAGRHGQPFARLMARQADRARRFYRAAAGARPAADARTLVPAEIMGRIYHALLEEIEARQFRVLDERVTLPARRKIAIALRCWAGARLRRDAAGGAAA